MSVPDAVDDSCIGRRSLRSTNSSTRKEHVSASECHAGERENLSKTDSIQDLRYSHDPGSKSKFGDCEADLVGGSVSDMCV